jgi:hypothetical protein
LQVENRNVLNCCTSPDRGRQQLRRSDVRKPQTSRESHLGLRSTRSAWRALAVWRINPRSGSTVIQAVRIKPELQRLVR